MDFWEIFDDTIKVNQLQQNKNSILKICDYINNNKINNDDVVARIFFKINSYNLHVCYFSVKLLEAIIKNCESIKNIVSKNDDCIQHLKEASKKDKKIQEITTNILEILHPINNEKEKNQTENNGFNFNTEIAEVLKIKKEEHEKYLKNNNSSEKSQEESAVHSEAVQQENNFSKIQKVLSKELSKIKEARLHATAQAAEVRKSIHDKNLANHNFSDGVRRCEKNCSDCQKINETLRTKEEKVEIVHQLPKVLRVEKELRKNVELEIPKIRKEKQELYYGNRIAITRPTSTSINRSVDSSNQIQDQENLNEGEDLNQAMNNSLSQIDDFSDYDEDYDEELEKALALSLISYETSDLDLSPINYEELDALTLEFAMKNSLEETNDDSSSGSINNDDLHYCTICLNNKPVVYTFRPCGHKAICCDCLEDWRKKELSKCTLCCREYDYIEYV